MELIMAGWMDGWIVDGWTDGRIGGQADALHWASSSLSLYQLPSLPNFSRSARDSPKDWPSIILSILSFFLISSPSYFLFFRM